MEDPTTIPLSPMSLPDAPADVLLFLQTEAATRPPDNPAEWLDAEEMARANRFRFAADRGRFLKAHILKRRALNRIAPDVPAPAWTFDRPEPNGKPFAIGPDGQRGPEFSLFHCDGLVGVAIARARAVGLDGEPTHRPDLTVELAQASFAPTEIARAGTAPTATTLARLWCGKEALAKAVGQGLAIDFTKLVIDPEHMRAVSAPPPVAVDDWALIYPGGPNGFTVALAWKKN